MDKYTDPTATPAQEFTDGGPSIPRTVLRAVWLNMIQRELVNLVEKAGFVLSAIDFEQVYKAVKRIAADWGNPVGNVSLHMGTVAPEFWLEMDGSLKLRADYPRLWEHAQSKTSVVTDAAWLAGDFGSFSSGDGATTFRLPDARGEFLRAWDHGRGVDAGRTLGSDQASADNGITQVKTFSSFGGLSNGPVVIPGDGSWSPHVTTTNNLGTGASMHIQFKKAGSEVRPRNIALMAIIKA